MRVASISRYILVVSSGILYVGGGGVDARAHNSVHHHHANEDGDANSSTRTTNRRRVLISKNEVREMLICSLQIIYRSYTYLQMIISNISIICFCRILQIQSGQAAQQHILI